jgi:hypothetical protein
MPAAGPDMIFIASPRRVFYRPAVSVNLDLAQAAPSVSFQYPSSLWMQTSFTSVKKAASLAAALCQ